MTSEGGQSDADSLSAGAPGREQYLTAEEAATYVGVAARELGSLAEQYGIGRRYILEPTPRWAYARSDLEKIKAAVAKRPVPAAATPAAPAAKTE